MMDRTPSTELTAPWIEAPALQFDRSRSWQEQLAGVPDEAVSRGKTLLTAVLAEIPDSAKLLADAVRLRTRNRFHAETLAIARRTGESWRSILLAGVSYDLALAFLGCSTIALATPTGPVLARNMDWVPEVLLARATYRIRVSIRDDLMYACAGWPGAIGVVTGLSGRGFAIALNAVRSPERIDLSGYPIMLHIRRVLEDAPDFDAAVNWLAHERLPVGCLLTVVGRDNSQRVVIERSPRRHALRRPLTSEPILATNHYRTLCSPNADDDVIDSMCPRYEALAAYFQAHDDTTEVSDAQLLYALSDPAVRQDITAQHVIIRPATNTLRAFVPRHLS